MNELPRHVVYLIHLDEVIGNAQNYVGRTRDLKRRIRDHRAGRGWQNFKTAKVRGVGWRVVCTWPYEPGLERRIKARAKYYCPVCNAEQEDAL